MSALFSDSRDPSVSTMEWAEDEAAVLANACERIAANPSASVLGRQFGQLAMALRENPLSYEVIRERLAACEIVRRQDEAILIEEVNREARLIEIALGQLLMRKDADGRRFPSLAFVLSGFLSRSAKPSPRLAPASAPALDAEGLEPLAAEAADANDTSFGKAGRVAPATAPTNFIKTIAEFIESLRLAATSNRRHLEARLEESIDQISVENNLLMKSLLDYTEELRSYRDWASRQSFR